jgi:Spy/CpxP family protein refolding chaperone
MTRIAAGVGVLVAGMALAAWADGAGFIDQDGDGINDRAGMAHQMRGRMGGPFGMNLKNLTLTTDQQTAVDKLKADHKTAVSTLFTALKTKQSELRTLKSAATQDQAAITAKLAEIDGIRSQIQTANTGYRDSVLGLLTADQRGALQADRLGLKGVTLTADQLAQIDKLATDHEKAASTLQTAMQAKQSELRDLMKASTPDKTAINAKIDELNTAMAALQKENAAYSIAVRGLLTTEQQAALDAARATGFRGGMGRGHGMGRGRR